MDLVGKYKIKMKNLFSILIVTLFAVSVGGLAGLFFGASLLTLVEAIYLIIRA